MGTTCTHKPRGVPVAQFLIDHGVFRWSDDQPYVYRVLDSALVNLTEFYAAVEMVNKETGVRRVWAAMVKVTFIRSKRCSYGECENFCYKDMDESMGPYYTNCPERILNLLTPTENEYAIEWRRACWARINKKKARPANKRGLCLLYGGDVFVLEESLGPRGWKATQAETGYSYRMKRSQVARSEVLCQA